jgi:starch phosphorylase
MSTERQIRQLPEDEIELGLDARTIRRDFVQKLFLELAKFPGVATRNDHYLALAYVIRDRLLHRWVRSARTFLEGEHRTVIYLSAEYLLGPQLAHSLHNLDVVEEARTALADLGLDLDHLIEHEEEPGLGNGGLGRLAACFMDSLATLDIPAIGHGLRYEFGIFDQQIRDGWQVERTDLWLRLGNPWEIRRHDIDITVGFGGRCVHQTDDAGRYRVHWEPERVVKGVPYDTPVPGYGTTNANFLRLWSAVAAEDFDLDAFQVGEYWRAVQAKIGSENITKVVYPSDEHAVGKQLRLEQEYFFVSCALQDCIRLLLQRTTLDQFADKFALQLNDTHPSLAVTELMRLLVDVHGLSWDAAWKITHRSIAYTNHTLMPEALETWPLPLFQRLLPRNTEILFEINRRFLTAVVERFPDEPDRVTRMSLIDERGEKTVRMAYLATVASHAVNGVAELHSRLLRETVLRDFAEMYPERFTNVTNGVTPRRFVALANPKLTSLITEAIGDGWQRDLDRLRGLEKHAADAGFRQRWRAVKTANKEALAHWLRDNHARDIEPAAMVDAQCKRIHEYKRQHLNVLHVVWLYDRIRRGLDDGAQRTVLFAGKAAPGYRMAKLIVRLIHGVAETIEHDPVVRRHLRVVFVPDFNVKNAQRIYPAADLSEQISTAGYEASGTGNMKFALNGALTIGTLDGANVEIREQVGADNFFLFGLTAEEVSARKAEGHVPRHELERDAELLHVIELISNDVFSPRDKGVFRPLVRQLVEQDPFLVLPDFRAYVECQRQVSTAWQDVDGWTRKSILNTARMGHFSSDRSIREYAERIWKVDPVKVGPTTADPTTAGPATTSAPVRRRG